ncbi:MAG TPA: PAS domain S-box protein [Candidatus Acidoferrales bacterium]|nr:PAS domain S-box protein [Candidatus Acidoferrales bacterium]
MAILKTSSAVLGLSFQRLSDDELITRLAAIVGSSDDAVIGKDEQGIINTWNSAATRIFGYTPDEMIGQSALLLIPPELQQEELEIRDRLARGERVEPFETQRLRKAGDRVEVSVAASAIINSKGRNIGSALVVRDISSLMREHTARARLAAIVESSEDAIVAKDLNGIVTDWNAAAERMLGYTADEIIGRSILTIIPPELQHEEAVILNALKTGRRLEHYETERLHKSGKRIEVSLTLSPIRDPKGRIIGVSKIIRDITEGKRAEAARAMLAAIVESSEDAIISKTLDGIITSWNAAAERLFGYKPEEIIGHSVLQLIPPELHFEEPQIISKLRRGERIEHFETRRRHKNGHVFDIALTVSPVRDAVGRVVGASKIVRDISDRKAAEAALIQREKMVAAGRMAATLAHEVNNPLESITNLAFLLSENKSLDDNARHYAQLLLHEVQRAGDITRQTLNFYRDSRITTEVNVVETIEHVLRSKRNKLAAKQITVITHFSGPRSVHGYAGELRQVFDNLIENAVDAVGLGGHIRVRTKTMGVSDHRRLTISICDNGSGIARDRMKVIFDPFFTTKLRSGTGLGLWITQEIIRRHGGTVRARSTEGKGAVFSVTLPATGESKREPIPQLAT